MSFVEKIWYGHHWAAWALAPLLWPLACLYSALGQRRRHAFLSGALAAYRPPVPVVVIGNITAGGNGKTPLVIWLVEQLKAQGMKPGVVSRGYGGKAPHYPYVLDENTLPKTAGDEPVFIHQRACVPVAVSPKRAEAVKALLDLDVDIIITDDGLQHYFLCRDIEIAVIDGERRFGNGHFIPQGPLREGLERLDEVDFIVCNGGRARAGEIGMSLKPRLFVNLKTGEKRAANTFSNAVAMAGIGNPQRFFNTLLSEGISLKNTVPFADHHAFNLKQLEGLTLEGEALLMTEKDAVKCRAFIKDKPRIEHWWYLPVDAMFSEQDTLLLIETIKKVKDSYGSPIS